MKISLMQKSVFLLLLIFPALTFGQSYTGNYRAIFFNVFSEPRTVIAEFEITADNAVSAKVKVGDDIKLLNGAVDKKGKFEAVSAAEGNLVYKLKGKFDKENKISFIQRVEEKNDLNKRVSENALEGNFAKIEKSPETAVKKVVPLVDTGKSWLNINHSSPLFGINWQEFVGEIEYETWKSDGKVHFELKAKFETAQRKQAFRVTTPMESGQKNWKMNEINSTSYREENTETNEQNFFINGAAIYNERSDMSEGSFEIIKETENQVVFKLTNFRIKRLGKNDYVELNGFIYADKKS